MEPSDAPIAPAMVLLPNVSEKPLPHQPARHAGYLQASDIRSLVNKYLTIFSPASSTNRVDFLSYPVIAWSCRMNGRGWSFCLPVVLLLCCGLPAQAAGGGGALSYHVVEQSLADAARA